MAHHRNSLVPRPCLDLEGFRAFLAEAEGSALRAWLKFFDHEVELRVTQLQFGHGMRQMNCPTDPAGTFLLLDDDRSGELALEEVHESQADLWRRFREWSASTFEGSKDIVQRLTEGSAPGIPVSPLLFSNGLARLGWQGGEDELLFRAFDLEDQGQLTAQEFRWLDIEVRRSRRKELAKQRAAQDRRRHAKTNQHVAKALLERFKKYLKKTYGSYIRAWRVALSPADTMVVQRVQFFRALADMGFRSDMKLIWRALGKDETGSLSLDELDARSACILAHFQVFVERKLGGAEAAFRALDRTNVRKVRQAEFEETLRSMNFQQPLRFLFRGLDRQGAKVLTEEDLLFLDRWRPPAFLVVPPNAQARDELKAALRHRYNYYLKAWRRTLDLDSSNRCVWGEFQAACKKVGFAGDVPGAWRALDDDMSGYITLREIDFESSDTLCAFRRWAEAEFGSVRSAYGVFDDDGSNSVSAREFRRFCRIYGYAGSASRLFRALDVDGSGTLSLEDVAFLDEWEMAIEAAAASGGATQAAARPESRRPRASGPSRASATSRQGTPSLSPSPESGHSPPLGGSPSPASLRASLLGGGGGPRQSPTPRPTLALPERVYWSDVSQQLPSPTRSSRAPSRAGPAGRAASPTFEPSVWCSLCRARGRCRHLALGPARPAARSATPAAATPRRCHGAAAFPTTLEGDRRADRTRRRRQLRQRRWAAARGEEDLWGLPADLLDAAPEARGAPSVSSALLPALSAPGADGVDDGSTRGGAGEADVDVQVLALSRFPMGSVSSVYARAALCRAATASPTSPTSSPGCAVSALASTAG